MSFARSIMAKTKSSTTKQHYVAHTSSTYESAFFYSVGDYTSHLRDLVLESFKVKSNVPATIETPAGKTSERWKPDMALSKETNNFKIMETKDRIRIMDIGGGTGNFTKMMIEHSPPNVDAVVIDPFLSSNESSAVISLADKSNQIHFVKAGAEDFIPIPNDLTDAIKNNKDNKNPWWKHNYHQCLMKEVVHHFHSKDRIPIFQGIYDSLLPLSTSNLSPIQQSSFIFSETTDISPPSVLIITRPQVDIDYPLWPEAKQVWKDNQPSEIEIMQDLQAAGFTQVSHEMKINECRVELETWCKMIRNRFWSTFSNFTDDELELACMAIKKRYEAEKKDGTGSEVNEEKVQLLFEDRLLFITGRKEISF